LERTKAKQSAVSAAEVREENGYKKKKRQEAALRKQKSAILRLERQIEQNEK
jgi:hypothetical protein